MNKLYKKWANLSIVKRILIGMALGIVLALLIPTYVKPLTILGTLFVGALKAVAPLLVLFLVVSAISKHKSGQHTNMKSILVLYLLGTFLAGTIAVVVSFIFPTEILLKAADPTIAPPKDFYEVVKNLMLNIVDNPVNAILKTNYIGILSWAVVLGLALKKASQTTLTVIDNITDALSQIVIWVINFAPLGIMGLVIDSITANGLDAFRVYFKLILVLVGTMAFVALVLNPIIVFIKIRQNPYPLVLKCLKDSGITAFFTRSSAANVPVNMELCKEMNLDPDTYSVSIPLGATINMAGAAITISTLTLAAAHTIGIQVDFGSALILCILSAISACGASGVTGGSLLLIPLACSLFGIENDIAMQVVGVGYVIGIIQDSCETALNSSTDLLFTAAAEFSNWKKEGKKLPF